MRTEQLCVFGSFYAAVLDSLIDEAAEIFKEYYQIEELGDPTIQAQVRLSQLNGTPWLQTLIAPSSLSPHRTRSSSSGDCAPKPTRQR